MGKTLPWIGLIGLATILGAINICHPHLTSDANAFLHGFVNHEFLATLGFIAAVTLASAANIHLELNRLEDETDTNFIRTRNSLRKSSASLIILLGASVVIVVVKPLVSAEEHATSFMNSLALLVVYFFIVTIYDLSLAVFRIPTKKAILAKRDAEEP